MTVEMHTANTRFLANPPLFSGVCQNAKCNSQKQKIKPQKCRAKKQSKNAEQKRSKKAEQKRRAKRRAKIAKTQG